MTKFELLTIYDRYGKVIYTTKNITQGWNGTFKNNPQPGGTFVWTVSGTDYKGNKIIRNGTVVLIR